MVGLIKKDRAIRIVPDTRMRRKNHHILIIDDDPNIRMLLEFVLRKHYQIATRADALSALSWMSMGNIPDLIIVDMEMPRLNGYQFLRNIRGSGFLERYRLSCSQPMKVTV